jgi:hypothetical protein
LMEAMGDEDDVKKEGLDDDHHHPTHPIQVSQTHTHTNTHMYGRRDDPTNPIQVSYIRPYIYMCVCVRARERVCVCACARACVRALGYICMRRI